jgi:(S)-mandelate dehydrogenase
MGLGDALFSGGSPDALPPGARMFRKKIDDALNNHDMRDMARQCLPHWMFEFVDRGTGDEVALRDNRAAFERIKLKTQVLIDVSKRQQRTTLFGKQHDMPIGIAPTGAAGMMYYQGELALARAAKAANIPFTLATGSQTSIEDVARLVGGTLWFQLYMWSDRQLSHMLVERAKNNGFEALLVTVDAPVFTYREYNIRNGFSVPFRYNRKNTAAVLARPGWLINVFLKYLLTTGIPKRENYPTALKDRVTQVSSIDKKTKNDSLTWDDLSALRDIWPGKLIVKGILRPEDAEQAVARGADGIVVSNHGGRNFDSSLPPIDVLPSIVDALGERTTVIVDSGFRRGEDVVKALALGAKFVLSGRPMLWGATVGGEPGVARSIDFFRQEIDRALGYMGCNSVADLHRGLLDYVATPHMPTKM